MSRGRSTSGSEITMEYVKSVLQEDGALQELCQSENINKWSRYKPTAASGVGLIGGVWNPLKGMWTKEENYIFGGLGTESKVLGARLLDKLSDAIDIETGEMNPDAVWHYNRPDGSKSHPCRLHDFKGYSTNAAPPFTIFAVIDAESDGSGYIKAAVSDVWAEEEEGYTDDEKIEAARARGEFAFPELNKVVQRESSDGGTVAGFNHLYLGLCVYNLSKKQMLCTTADEEIYDGQNITLSIASTGRIYVEGEDYIEWAEGDTIVAFAYLSESGSMFYKASAVTESTTLNDNGACSAFMTDDSNQVKIATISAEEKKTVAVVFGMEQKAGGYTADVSEYLEDYETLYPKGAFFNESGNIVKAEMCETQKTYKLTFSTVNQANVMANSVASLIVSVVLYVTMRDEDGEEYYSTKTISTGTYVPYEKNAVTFKIPAVNAYESQDGAKVGGNYQSAAIIPIYDTICLDEGEKEIETGVALRVKMSLTDDYKEEYKLSVESTSGVSIDNWVLDVLE